MGSNIQQTVYNLGGAEHSLPPATVVQISLLTSASLKRRV